MTSPRQTVGHPDPSTLNAQPPPSLKPPGAAASRELAFQNPCRYPEAKARQVRPWLSDLLDALDPAGGTFVVRFVSDREMRRLNREYRGKDQATDVLSFPGESADNSEGGDRHLGDVALSVPTARRQAASRGHSVERELRVLILHGVLHCLGHDHETDQGQMEALEAKLCRRWIPHV